MKATKVTPEEGRDQDGEPGTEEAQHVSAPRTLVSDPVRLGRPTLFLRPPIDSF